METIVDELESLARIMTNPAMLVIVASIALAFVSGAVARSIELLQDRRLRVARRQIGPDPVGRPARVRQDVPGVKSTAMGTTRALPGRSSLVPSGDPHPDRCLLLH